MNTTTNAVNEIAATAARVKTAEAAIVKLLTLAQVAERLQISRTTVWRLVNERGLRTVRCGGLVRVRESDLAAWIEKHTTASGTEGSASQ